MDKKTIVLASKNPVKIKAVANGFQRMFRETEFEIKTVFVASGVADQPGSNQETFWGALNRVNNAMQAVGNSDFWIGIEGGIEDTGDGMAAFAWVVVKSNRLTGKARTGTFFLPDKIAQLVRAGKELGEADDIVFGRTNSKQDGGAIGILTQNVIDRTQLYEHAVALALVPFKNENLYCD